MFASLTRVLHDRDGSVRGKVMGMYAFLIALNLVVWGLTLAAAIKYPVLLASGVLAYSFGLRHAVDADHISAIDNVTRKLMQEGKRPVAVGFFFSLGHSTIVVLLTVAIAFAANVVNKNLPGFKSVGALIGTSVSALFLYLIAALNLVILVGIFKLFRHVTRGGAYSQESLDEFLAQRGLMGRFFRPLFRLITHSWNMYPVGVLFGLGFDTATEVGVISLGALAAANGMPIVYVLLLPLLFTAGMSLADTTDGIMMLGAYGWAFVKPVRKLYYNLNITLISVLVALVVGTIEVMQIVSNELHLGGPFWGFMNNTLSLGNLGFFIVGIFVVAWLASTIIYRVKRYEDLDVKQPPAPKPATGAA
ncbi:MAG TPA: HoxN/HupN/NixA family nickel/cobalt transporter [Ktedonobacterales bacterium]|jgi:high-affinity nickel-transport protein|nr:HoxN/HupN/NixA family nickel/cobalt transporter [Ktedonobacterales bacterium]